MIKRNKHIGNLTQRREYLRLAETGRRWVTRGVMVQYAPPPETGTKVSPRFGITVSKKVGGAVVRNLVKRRLREVIRLTLRQHGQAGASYVLVARNGSNQLAYARLTGDLIWALEKLHQGADLKSRKTKPKPGKKDRAT